MNIRFAIVALLLLLCATGDGTAFAGESVEKMILGTVVSIEDGDTIGIRNNDGKNLRVQLAYIDAPDLDRKSGKSQPFHSESTSYLKNLIAGHEVVVESFGVDKFGKVRGIVYLDRINANLDLVRRGFAEVYHPMRQAPSRYNTDYLDKLFLAEKMAKDEERGIWGDPDYMSPYQFRRQNKKQ